MSDRKYGQPGYKDEDRPARRGGGPRPPKKDGPRGRGLGAPKAQVFRCGNCNEKQSVGEPEGDTLAFDATCPKCSEALHACVNCVNFDPTAPKECRLPDIERVAKKRAANRCDEFSPKVVVEFSQDQTREPDDPKSAFDALFDF